MAVTVEGIALAPQVCLLDTGSLHNRFAAWVAHAAGIDLADASEKHLAVGGFTATAREALVALTLGGVTWEAPVFFCDPWPLGFQLLGQEGFFRYFAVQIRASRLEMEITPER